MGYVPSTEILERYAKLAVHYGLNEGEGMSPGQTVMVYGREDTKPLYHAVCREVWRTGGHVVHNFLPEDEEPYNFATTYYDVASPAQLEHFAESHVRGLIAEIDHIVFITGDRAPLAMQTVDSAKLAAEAPAQQRYWEIRNAKERAGDLHWTIVAWGTEAMAAEAGCSIEAYWDQIIAACCLDDPDPVARNREMKARVNAYRDWLNSLPIDRLHLEAEGTDLWLTLGERRAWRGGTSVNIPSFEVFTSPDWRGTHGTVRFSEPLYYYGKLLRGVELEFADGEVIRADAEEGAEQIRAMVAMPGGNRVGEFSLTDARLSRITRFMADTLYDENVGGRYGNSHVAIGLSITDCFDGDEAATSDEEFQALGYNTQAALHADIIATTDRTVTAVLRDGTQQVIYADGRFQHDA